MLPFAYSLSYLLISNAVQNIVLHNWGLGKLIGSGIGFFLFFFPIFLYFSIFL